MCAPKRDTKAGASESAGKSIRESRRDSRGKKRVSRAKTPKQSDRSRNCIERTADTTDGESVGPAAVPASLRRNANDADVSTGGNSSVMGLEGRSRTTASLVGVIVCALTPER